MVDAPDQVEVPAGGSSAAILKTQRRIEQEVEEQLVDMTILQII
jgi:hypothetical protein